MKRLFPLLLVAACGGDPFVPAQTCTVPGFGSVYLESARDCACVERVLLGAQRTIHEAFGTRAIYFDVVDVWVQDAPVGIDGEPMRVGVYSREGERGRVVLARDMRSAAHELLHHVELQRLRVPEDASVEHRGWKGRRFDVRPFTLIDVQFKEAYTPPRVESCPLMSR